MVAAVQLVSGVVNSINEDIKRQEKRFKVRGSVGSRHTLNLFLYINKMKNQFHHLHTHSFDPRTTKHKTR